MTQTVSDGLLPRMARLRKRSPLTCDFSVERVTGLETRRLVCRPASARSQSNRAELYQAGAQPAPQGGRRPLITSPHGLATAREPVMAEAIAERVRRYILDGSDEDRKSTRLNSSHPSISYAVF